MTEFEKVKVLKVLKVLKLCKLKASERAFIRSLEDYMEKTGRLTERQVNALYSIYERG